MTPPFVSREILRATLTPRQTFYAPGIPLVMPGEKISAQVIELIGREKFSGGRIIGAVDKNLSTIRVVDDIINPKFF